MDSVWLTRNLCIARWKWCFYCFGTSSLSTQLEALYCACVL